MDTSTTLYTPFITGLICIGMVVFFALMIKWARKRKGAAMAFGILVQMFLPDPKVEQTIEMVAEKKETKHNKGAAADNDGDNGEDKPAN